MPDGSWWKLPRQKENLMASGVPPIKPFVALMLALGFGQSSQFVLELLFVMAERWQKASSRTLPACKLHSVSKSWFLICPVFGGEMQDWLLRFAQWSSFLYIFPSLSVPLFMILVFGQQVHISLVDFFKITVIIAYTVNYIKNDIMEVIY